MDTARRHRNLESALESVGLKDGRYPFQAPNRPLPNRIEPERQQAFVALEGVSKHFPGVVALDGVSLNLNPGEVHVLLGENGAGKSTLISLLSGMQQPDQGRLVIDGVPQRLSSPRDALQRGVGTVYQHTTLVPGLSIVDNLILGAAWWSRPKRLDVRARVSAMCDRMGMDLPFDATLSSLSLGQRQLVEIIKALWRSNRLLILDEPTSMLGSDEIDQLYKAVVRLRDAGTAILFITHKLDEAIRFGDRISVLKAGRLAGQLAPVELKSLERPILIERIISLMFDTTASPSFSTPSARPATLRGPIVLRVQDIRAAASPDEPRLEGITFSLSAGEILGIAGVEGNGQKQLAEVLAGQRRFLAGSIELEGTPIHSLGVRARQKLGLRYLSDDRLGEGSLPNFPIDLNLLLKRIGEPPFWRSGWQRASAIEAHARALIDHYQIRAGGPRSRLSQLSGGNIQKLLLARELDGAPKVVIYNKPTYGLDLQSIRNARSAILAQAERGVAGLLISTDLEELLELSDRIAVMYRGRLVGILEGQGLSRRRLGELMVGREHAQ